MSRFAAGVVLGALALAGLAAWFVRGDLACFGRCAPGTRCADRRCVAAAPSEPAAVPPPKAGRRRTHTGAAPLELRAGDERRAVEGDALGRTERIDLTEDGPAGKELGQEDLDAGFAPAQPKIEKCVTDALGDAPLASGRVEVGLRVGRSGQLERVRVEAPQLLLRRGLYRCVRTAVQSARFPASGGASVVTFPFELR